MEQAEKRSPERIYLYRSEGGKFWWCAIPWVDQQGKRRQRRKVFRDKRHGSERAAFLSARAWRDDELKKPAAQLAQGGRKFLTLVTVEDPHDIDFTGNPFGLSGVTVAYREQTNSVHVCVTANRGRKRWFSMRRYGPLEAFKKGVHQRCRWIGVPYPENRDLELRFWHWAENHVDELHRFGLNP
ncbi:MAG: hypothetical protein K0U65_00105 [Gammaproteobacteria bacterium]|nr:hypothetical protein [Gammaproteobacteria bacterium]